MSLPKGIINIISDYAHTLFYMEELQDKTEQIHNSIRLYKGSDLSYYYVGILILNNKFIIGNGTYGAGAARNKLFDRENKRRVCFGLKENYNLFPKGYNRVYQSY